MGARVTGLEANIRRLKSIGGQETAKRISQALFVTGHAIQVDAQISISTGAVSGRDHVPSLPGQPPNNDTGLLADSIETVQVDPLKIEVSANAPYAVALEFGTSKMAERPFMRPAAAKNKDTLSKNVAAVIAAAVAGK
jgi:HK97 gp10 family phage protein